MKWKRINRKKLPKTGMIVAGSWRKAFGAKTPHWSMSSVSDHGLPLWVDSDRTHYIRLPNPPKRHEC